MVDYQDYSNNDGPNWSKISNKIQQETTQIKNRYWNSRYVKYEDWKQYFDHGMDISFAQGSFKDIKNEINRKKESQDKYILTNTLSRVLEDYLKPFKSIDLKNGKIQFFKDCGLKRKEEKKKLGLYAVVGADNLIDSTDRLRVCIWGGINDPVNNEASIKLNYYSPSMPPEKNVNNFQIKGRYQIISDVQQEYLYQAKYQTLNKNLNKIYTFSTKMYLNEMRGIDRPNILFSINSKTLPLKTIKDSSSITSQIKNIVTFDFTRKSAFFKSIYYSNYQNVSTLNIGSNNLLYLNFINNYQRSSIASIRQVIQNEKLYVNYQPGYINIYYDEGNQNLLHCIQNTSKFEIIKFIPYIDPFVQLHSSLQLKTLNFGQYLSIKAFFRDNCKIVATTGCTLDLGFVKVGILYNLLDLIPYVLKNPQHLSFQNFQIHFSQ